MTSQASEIESGLEQFIKYFVTNFETYFAEYYKRLRQRVGITGKSADLLREILEISKSGTEITESVLKATSSISISLLLQSLITSTVHHKNRKNRKKLSSELYKFKKNPLKVRQILVDCAATVFVKYEPLFLKLTTTDQSKSWQRGLEKVAREAVSRTIDYLERNPEEDFTVTLLTKGVILGQSKKYKHPYKVINTHRQRSIEIVGGLKIKTTEDLFEKVGLIDDKNNYYIKKSATGYGFRALFEWETIESSTSYVITDPPSSFDYRFTLQKNVKEIADSVLQKLDLHGNGDSKLLKQTIEDVHKKADKLLELLDQNYEEISPFFKKINEELTEIEKKEDNKVDENIDHVTRVAEELLQKATDYLMATNKILEDETPIFVESIQPEAKDEGKGNRVWYGVTEPTNLFTGRTNIIKTLRTFLQNEEYKAVTVCGSQGVGKSELVRKYIKDYGEKDFKNILWINSENDTFIIESFFMLANYKLNIRTLEVNAEEKNLAFVIDKVIRYFIGQKSNERTLFVLDNADKSVLKFLNRFYSLEEEEKRVRILITSCQEWNGSVKSLNLKELVLEEATELVRKGLGMKEPVEDQEVKELVEVLQCFPLALQQAVAYINGKRAKEKFKIGDYLEKFKKKRKNILNPMFDEMGKETIATATVWKMTMNRIKSVTKIGPLACEILNIMAFLAPENIGRDWFLKRIEDEKLLKRTVHLLVEYSMINGKETKSILSVHQLVQQVIQIELEINDQMMEVLDQTYTLLQRNNPADVKTIPSGKKRRQLLLHYEFFYCYLEKRIENCPEDKEEIERTYIEGLLRTMADAYNNIVGNSKRQCELLERLLTIIKKHHEEEDKAFVLFRLGTLYISLGNAGKAKEFLEEALKVFKKNGNQKLLEAMTLTILGYCYGLLGDFIKELQLLNESVIIQTSALENYEKLGSNYQNLILLWSRTLANLGNAYGHLLDYDYQVYLNVSALRIYEDVLEPNHFMIGAVLMNLSYEHGNQDRYAQQLESLAKPEEIRVSHHPEQATSFVPMGQSYNGLRDPLRAKGYLERVNEIQNEFHNGGNFDIIPTLIQLGESYGQLGDHEKKIYCLLSALTIGKGFYEEDALIIADIKTNLSEAYRDLKKHEKQLELLKEVLHIQEKHIKNHPFKTVYTLCQIAKVYGILGDDPKKEEALASALDIINRFSSADKNDYLLISPLSTLAFTYNDSQKRRELFERVLEMSEKYYGPKHIITAKALYNVALSYRSERLEQIKLLERVIKIQEEHYKNDNIEMTDCLKSLALAYASMGNLKRTVALYERIVKVYEDFWGSDHINTASILTDLASFYRLLQNNKKAVKLLNRALNIQKSFYSDYELVPLLIKLGEASNQTNYLEKALYLTRKHFKGPMNPEYAKILNVLAKSYSDLDRREELQEEAYFITMKYWGLEHLQTTDIMVSLMNTYINSGKAERAQGMLQEVTKTLKKLYCKADITTTVQLRTLAEIHGHFKGYQQMKELLEMSLEIEESSFGKNHPGLMATLQALSVVYKALDLLEKERNVLEQQLTIIDEHYRTDLIMPLTRLARLTLIYEKSNELSKRSNAVERLVHSFKRLFGKSVKAKYFLKDIEMLATSDGWDTFKKKFETHFLISSVHKGKLFNVVALLLSREDFFAKNEHSTLLHIAVTGKDVKVLRVILYFILEKHKENVSDYLNAKNKKGNTPLIQAAKMGKTEMAKILLSYGCDINAQNNYGETALHWATKKGFVQTMQLLLSKNADVNIKNNDNQTALDVAKTFFCKDPDDEVYKTLYAHKMAD